MSTNKLIYMLRGQEVNLHEIDPGLHRVNVCLGWVAPEQSKGVPVDLDTSAFLLGRDNRVRKDSDFVFYNNLETDGGVVKHMGDNLTGGTGEGDADCRNAGNRPRWPALRYRAGGFHRDDPQLGRTAAALRPCDRRLYPHRQSGYEGGARPRFNLTEGAVNEDAFVFGEIYRIGMGWKFKAVGYGSTGGLYKIARDFNVNVAPM